MVTFYFCRVIFRKSCAFCDLQSSGMCWCKLAAQKWGDTDWCNFSVFNSPGWFFCLQWVNFSLMLMKVEDKTVEGFCTGQCNRPVRHATYLCFCHLPNANIEKGLKEADCRRMTGIQLGK